MGAEMQPGDAPDASNNLKREGDPEWRNQVLVQQVVRLRDTICITTDLDLASKATHHASLALSKTNSTTSGGLHSRSAAHRIDTTMHSPIGIVVVSFLRVISFSRPFTHFSLIMFYTLMLR